MLATEISIIPDLKENSFQFSSHTPKKYTFEDFRKSDLNERLKMINKKYREEFISRSPFSYLNEQIKDDISKKKQKILTSKNKSSSIQNSFEEKNEIAKLLSQCYFKLKKNKNSNQIKEFENSSLFVYSGDKNNKVLKESVCKNQNKKILLNKKKDNSFEKTMNVNELIKMTEKSFESKENVSSEDLGENHSSPIRKFPNLHTKFISNNNNNYLFGKRV